MADHFVLPAGDAWRTQLMETGEAFVVFGPSDDIGEVVDVIRAAAGDLGLDHDELRIDLSGPSWMMKVGVISE